MRILLETGELKNNPNYPAVYPLKMVEMARNNLISNHNQTPERLHERGGVHPKEMLCALLNCRIDHANIGWKESLSLMKKLIEIYD